ncbi:saccharopine dehydrogenase NADP-binding domain-containing protein [Oligoflexia bacterium]|nr:saccharopine dehydrogenase NADP-binding domain-containing protein [Oligoflexia bacterium]
MKQILILGAGKSSPYLIDYLLSLASKENWFISVCDINLGLAENRVNNHPNGKALYLDASEAKRRVDLIKCSDVVVDLLTPKFQPFLAAECLDLGKHMVSASYQDIKTGALHSAAKDSGILLLTEIGLDPGIDHIMITELIEKIRADGGEISGFYSYGGGLPAPENISNPLRYVITWNPRNVVMAGRYGAQYLRNGKINILPHGRVFKQTWNVEVEGVGTLEAYPNRDSLKYIDLFKLGNLRDMVRATLRYPGWCETWSQIVRIGMTNERINIPDLSKFTYKEVVEMFMPLSLDELDFKTALSQFLDISANGKAMQHLEWLGIFSDELVKCRGNTASEMLIDLLEEKLVLNPNHKDMVVLKHEMDVFYPEQPDRKEKVSSTMIEKGIPGKHTAMAKTVGLPIAIAVELILSGELEERGSLTPIDPMISQLLLRELKRERVEFCYGNIERAN